MSDPIKYVLDESRIPKNWYNIMADFPTPPAPPLHPGTGQPVGPEALEPIFPKVLIQQEMSGERWIEIPKPVREVYKQWRPSPLYRARRLERALDTPARIYYKYEGVSPSGSHKPNTAVPQAYYNAEAGIKRISTETGAGQWGSSLAFAGALFGIEIRVFMVRISFEQKPYRKALMQAFGATCVASPSEETEIGRKMRELYPGTTGSLGIAISEAMEVAAKDPGTNYSLGSVLNHVCLHQTVVGLEAIEQFELANDYPDIVIACAGGGSNFAGLAFPFLGAQLRGGKKVRVIAVEPAACPSLTKGKFAYDFGDTGQFTPLLKMFTLGSSFVPPGFHAGGLRYHGDSPIVSRLVHDGVMRAVAYHQSEVFEAAQTFARTEGIIVAPETSHAVRSAIDEALACKKTGEEKTILFNCSGHGNFDMSAYDAHLAGDLEDYEHPEEKIAEALSHLPKVG